MHSSKLIRIVRTLSTEEMRWMAKFVRSPYHNSNRDVTELFDHIRKYYPDCTSVQLARENVFRKIWPQETYNDRRLRLLMFRLSDLVEEFLVAQLLKRDKLQSEKLLVEALSERDLYDLFIRKTEVLIAELEQQPHRDERYYELRWQLKLLWLSHPDTLRLQIPEENLREIVALLDNFYAIAKLRYSSDLLNRQNILSENYEIALLAELRKLVPVNSVFQGNKVVQLYSDLLRLIEQPLREEFYEQVEISFLQHQQLLKVSDQSPILRCLINATTQLYLAGKSSYLENQFRLYRLGLDAELFIEKGKLPESTFLNIVVTGTILKQTTWVRSFIDGHAEMMSANILNFAEAYWHFAHQDFLSSNTFLLKVKEQDVSHHLRKKLLSLRNHYELFRNDHSYYTLFQDESRAFEKFLRRNDQITKKRARAYLNFLTCIRKIGKPRAAKQKLDKEQKARLVEEINQLQPLEARPWLLEKINDL